MIKQQALFATTLLVVAYLATQAMLHDSPKKLSKKTQLVIQKSDAPKLHTDETTMTQAQKLEANTGDQDLKNSVEKTEDLEANSEQLATTPEEPSEKTDFTEFTFEDRIDELEIENEVAQRTADENLEAESQNNLRENLIAQKTNEDRWKQIELRTGVNQKERVLAIYGDMQ